MKTKLNLIRFSLILVAFGMCFTPLRAEEYRILPVCPQGSTTTCPPVTAKDAPKPADSLAYQTARADAAEARAALADANAEYNRMMTLAANITIEYLQKLPALQAAKDATEKALEAARK